MFLVARKSGVAPLEIYEETSNEEDAVSAFDHMVGPSGVASPHQIGIWQDTGASTLQRRRDLESQLAEEE